jgi:Protein of unknown function (DUF982)
VLKRLSVVGARYALPTMAIFYVGFEMAALTPFSGAEFIGPPVSDDGRASTHHTPCGTGKMVPQFRSMWSASVPINLSPFQKLLISSLQEALICLRTQWPPDKGQDSHSFQRAVRLCTEAADGERSPAAARAAFIAAAREAGILGGLTPA